MTTAGKSFFKGQDENCCCARIASFWKASSSQALVICFGHTHPLERVLHHDLIVFATPQDSYLRVCGKQLIDCLASLIQTPEKPEGRRSISQGYDIAGALPQVLCRPIGCQRIIAIHK
jgi:hypothetical protein